MKILVINCGSSSLKYQLIDSTTEEPLAVGLCERIGIDGRLNHTPSSTGKKEVIEKAMPDHKVAIGMVVEALTNPEYGVIKELKEIDISNLTPLDALNTLYRLQTELKNRWNG